MDDPIARVNTLLQLAANIALESFKNVQISLRIEATDSPSVVCEAHTGKLVVTREQYYADVDELVLEWI